MPANLLLLAAALLVVQGPTLELGDCKLTQVWDANGSPMLRSTCPIKGPSDANAVQAIASPPRAPPAVPPAAPPSSDSSTAPSTWQCELMSQDGYGYHQPVPDSRNSDAGAAGFCGYPLQPPNDVCTPALCRMWCETQSANYCQLFHSGTCRAIFDSLGNGLSFQSGANYAEAWVCSLSS